MTETSASFEKEREESIAILETILHGGKLTIRETEDLVLRAPALRPAPSIYEDAELLANIRSDLKFGLLLIKTLAVEGWREALGLICVACSIEPASAPFFDIHRFVVLLFAMEEADSKTPGERRRRALARCPTELRPGILQLEDYVLAAKKLLKDQHEVSNG